MFECRLAQGSLLRKVMEAILPLVDSANIDCTSEGLTIQAMDSCHVCLVQMNLDADSFDPFRCDKNITLGIDIKNLLKVIRCAGNDDSVTLRAHDNSDSLNIIIESPDNERTASFEMKLMDIDAEHLAIPDSQTSAVVKMPSHQFQQLARDLSQFSDSIIIACTKEGVTFATSGTAASNGSAKFTLTPNPTADKKEEEQVIIEMNEPVNLTFACRYLAFFVKATPLSSTVSLSLKIDNPLVTEYKIGDSGYLRYYLAPKIEEDEGEENDIADE